MYITFLLVGLTFPLYTSKVTVNSLSVHFAVRIESDVILTTDSAVILSNTELYHPKNVYPALFGVGNSPYFSAYTTFFVLFSSSSPSLTLNVILYVFAVHFAYNSQSFSGLYRYPASPILSVNSLFLSHPLNVYPVFVAFGSSTGFLEYFAFNVSVPAPYLYVLPIKVPYPLSFSHPSNSCVCVITFVSLFSLL